MTSDLADGPRPRRRPRLPRPSPFVADAALAIALLLIAAYEYTHNIDDGYQAGPAALNVPLSVLELMPLAWRRKAPLASFLVGFGAVAVPSIFVAHTLFAYSGLFPLAFYLYTVARHCEWRVSRWAMLAPPVTLLLYGVHMPQIRNWSDAFFGGLVFGLAFLIGLTLRRQAAQRQALADALAQLDREQEQRERLAVLDERARLARELHDVVAHAVAVMLVQVGAARLSLDDGPDAARAGLLNAEQTGREATGDLRRLLGLLRAGDTRDGLHPSPGLDALTALQQQMTCAGLDVDIEVVGEPLPLSASLDLSAYRVVQEALTNVLKHAGPTSVCVRIDYSDPHSTGLRIEVVDAGPRGRPPESLPSGHGLIGMQERVALFGGKLWAGRQEKGFALRVELPVPREAACR